MRSFWISLLVFILLMCSCKGKRMLTDTSVSASYLDDTGYTRHWALVDTSKALRIDIDKSKLRIVETLKITEYDKESGKPVKETEAKRETTQDSDKVVSTEEERGLSEMKDDSLNHIAVVSKNVQSEVKEESKGGQVAFGKWFGIVIGIAVSIFFVYLLRKKRVN